MNISVGQRVHKVLADAGSLSGLTSRVIQELGHGASLELAIERALAAEYGLDLSDPSCEAMPGDRICTRSGIEEPGGIRDVVLLKLDVLDDIVNALGIDAIIPGWEAIKDTEQQVRAIASALELVLSSMSGVIEHLHPAHEDVEHMSVGTATEELKILASQMPSHAQVRALCALVAELPDDPQTQTLELLRRATLAAEARKADQLAPLAAVYTRLTGQTYFAGLSAEDMAADIARALGEEVVF